MDSGLKIQPGRALDWTPPDYREGVALYFHFPFCKTKCNYCDFNTYAGIETLKHDYVTALCREMNAWGQVLGNPPAASVFLGGGTPSYMDAADVASILESTFKVFPLKQDAEVTLEANPDDVSIQKLKAWGRSGVNRISMGAQSFNDGELTTLDRRHDAKDATRAFADIRSIFDNASLDLMYGLPNQQIKDWERTVRTALSLKPTHLSMYSLQLEPGTPMERDARLGKFPPPDEDAAADMYELANDLADSAGLHRYEISNWALEGRESRHNLAYWLSKPYLGIGSGAHSALGGFRFANVRSPRGYVSATRSLDAATLIKRGRSSPIEVMTDSSLIDTFEIVERRQAIQEMLMMGMRIREGVANCEFRARFGVDLREHCGETLDWLCNNGLTEWTESGVRLSTKGVLLGNEVFVRLSSL